VTATTLDLASAPVLLRATDRIVEWGHIKNDHIDHEDGGYDAAGAIADACGLDPADWDNHTAPPTGPDGPTYAPGVWEARRAAAIAALRTLVGHLRPDLKPEAMTRRELIEWAGDWNDHPDRTPAQVVTAMRAAAQEAVATP
jgi:hypothetical protein